MLPNLLEKLGPYVSQALGLPTESLLQAFRPAIEEDLPGILELRQAVLRDALWWDDEAFVRWRYFDNKSATEPTPYWVFERGKEIIGGIGLEPLVLVVDGEPCPAVRTLDIMVRPDVDGQGLGVLMNLVIFKHFPITLVTGGNERSRNLISRLFRHVIDLHVWKAIIKSRENVERRLGPGPVASAVAMVGDLFLAMDRRNWRHPLPKNLEIRELTRFDSWVMVLSQEFERTGRILVRRSPEYLNWRFVRNPRCRYRILGGLVGGKIVGYVVTRFNLSRPNPRKEAEIVDYLALPTIGGEISPLPFLIRAAVDQLVREGACLVSCTAFDDAIQTAVEASGLHRRPDERLPFFVQASPTALHERLSAGQGWYLTGCDSDVE
jgi:hypothetical protein